MAIAIFIMVAITLTALIGSHLALYYSFVNFFNLSDTRARLALLIILLFLSISFILSLILAHYWENFFTRAFYAISGFWLGLALNLLIASLIISILVWAAHVWHLNFNIRLTSCVIFFLTLVITLYGAWNATHPRLKNISVKIDNLPTTWQGKTIIQLSDLHLGYVHGENFLKRVVAETNLAKPDIIAITGDLFDGMDGSLEKFVPLLNQLESVDGVYFITGNHETYLGVARVFEVIKKTKIKILDNQVENLNGLQLIGVSYPHYGETVDAKKIIMSDKNYVYGRSTILLYHTPSNIEVSSGGKVGSQFKVYFYPNTNFTTARELGVNLQLSGHTHQGQIFPFEFLSAAIYNGYDYGLKTSGNFNIYTSSGAGSWGPPIRLGNRAEIVAIKLK